MRERGNRERCREREAARGEDMETERGERRREEEGERERISKRTSPLACPLGDALDT